MDKQDFFDILVLVLVMLFFIAMIFTLFYIQLLDREKTNNLRESKSMTVSSDYDYCVQGDKAYKIIYSEGYKIIKEVFTLE
jgi:hypothetical protein